MRQLLRNNLFWLIVISLMVRVGFSCVYPIQFFSDSGEYCRAAKLLFDTDCELASGKLLYPRVPGYPLLIAVAGGSPSVIVLLQSVMGVAIAVLLYLIFARITSRPLLSFLIGLAYSINPSQLLFEFTLLTETATTFMVTLAVFLLFLIVRRNGAVRWYHPALLGLTVGACMLTRSEYLVLAALTVLFLLLSFKTALRRRFFLTVVFFIPIILLSGGWKAYRQYRFPGNEYTCMYPGLQIVTHTVEFVEFAPDRFSGIRDVIIDHRERYRRQGGVDLCWAFSRSLPALLETTGLSLAELSDTLLVMTASTACKKPVKFLSSVTRAFVRFYKPTWYSRQFGIRSVIAGPRLSSKLVAIFYTMFHLACMATFLGYPFLYLCFPAVRDKTLICPESVFIYAFVFAVSVPQAVMILGDNMRYKTPVEPLMIGMALWIAAGLLSRLWTESPLNGVTHK